jgi:rRNA maturation endonuclease Nob1
MPTSSSVLSQMIQEAFTPDTPPTHNAQVRCPVCKRRTELFKSCKHCGVMVKRSRSKNRSAR